MVAITSKYTNLFPRKPPDDPQTMPIPLSDDFKRFLENEEIDKALVEKELARRSGVACEG
ncbi:Uncharacterised protein [Providencia stuartii]|nr:Uncharacterised protein [Providencia stuartii]